MKFLQLLAVLSLFAVSCDNEPQIDERIRVDFEADYPEATDVEWEIEDGFVEAEFDDANGKEVEVRYTMDGKKVSVNGEKVVVSTGNNNNSVTVDTRSNDEFSAIEFRAEMPFVESDIDLNLTTGSVRAAIARDYAGWEVHKVKQVEQDGRIFYKVELKNDALDKEVKPLYTPTGTLVSIDD